MEVPYDSEESYSSASPASSCSVETQDSQELSRDAFPKFILSPNKKRKQMSHILQKLYFREICGKFAPFSRAANLPLFSEVPQEHHIRLRNVLPESAIVTNHVFLGLSRCGQFLLSYTYTTELDVITFTQVYKYRLHWWAFIPHQRVRKVSEVMLFGNQGVYSILYIAVCQWPLDNSRILIYGNCKENYGSQVGALSSSPPERSYLTITTVPSLNKCQDCLRVAESYGEEDLAASWDSCVRFSCLKHGMTVHTNFDVVSPFPKFEPTICMKREGAVVVNTGSFLHVLRVELEHLGNIVTAVNKTDSNSGTAGDATESIDQNLASTGTLTASDGICQVKPDSLLTNTDVSGQDCWKENTSASSKLEDTDGEILHHGLRVYETRSRSYALSQQKKMSLQHQASSSSELKICEIPASQKQLDCSYGANSSLIKNVSTSETEKHSHKSRGGKIVLEDIDFDDDVEDSVGASDDCSQLFLALRGNRNCSEQNFEHCNSNKNLLAVGKSDRHENIVVSLEKRISDNLSNKRECDIKKNQESSSIGYHSKESSDRLKQTGINRSSCGKDNEGLSLREKAVKEFREGLFCGRITRSQSSRSAGRSDITETEESLDHITCTSHMSERRTYLSVDSVYSEQSEMILIGNRENRIMDATQELNITCGSTNGTFSEDSIPSVTLLSPVPGTLLAVNTTEESESDDCQSFPDRKVTTPSSSRLRRIRGGATVKLSSPLPALPATPHSSISNRNKIAEAEKAYEFTDEGLDPSCEKLSSFRRRRLADKKYEFCEEGEDAENIVPFRMTRRRESSPRLRSPPVYLSPSPVMLSHRRRHLDVLSDAPELIVSGPRSPSLIANDLPVNHIETDKVVLRPLNRNTTSALLLSPRDREGSTEWMKTASNKRIPLPEAVTLADNGALDKQEYNLLENVTSQPGSNPSAPVGARVAKKEYPSPGTNGSSPHTRCTVQLARRYIEVDDELVSVITDIEDDDFSGSTGYHCALPVEVHGAAYAQLQMISNTKAGKLMAPCVLVHQRSFDVEQFCHEIAERLCIEAGKKYWFCNDYDVEIVDVCPFSGDVIAVALMRIQATVKTKGLAKSQRYPVSSMERQQYQGSCKFVWNVDTGHYAVVWTRALHKVAPDDTVRDPWNPARELANELRRELNDVPVLQSVKKITNELVLKGISLSRITDMQNLIELTL